MKVSSLIGNKYIQIVIGIVVGLLLAYAIIATQ